MKRYAFVSIVLALLILGCGCAQQAGEPEIIDVPTEEGAARPWTNGRTEAGQPSEGGSAAKIVVGRVESIVGNEVVLALGTVEGGMGAQARAGMAGGTGELPEGASWPDRSSMAAGEMPEGMTRPEGFSRPEGGTFGGAGQDAQGFSGFSGGGASGDASANLEVTYTGETAVYLLPVGMEIGTGDFSSVSEGMVLQLFMDEDDTITAVSILSR